MFAGMPRSMARVAVALAMPIHDPIQSEIVLGAYPVVVFSQGLYTAKLDKECCSAGQIRSQWEVGLTYSLVTLTLLRYGPNKGSGSNP